MNFTKNPNVNRAMNIGIVAAGSIVAVNGAVDTYNSITKGLAGSGPKNWMIKSALSVLTIGVGVYAVNAALSNLETGE